MRVLICGSRHWVDVELIKDLVDSLPSDTIVIHGAAPGADTIAGRLADDRGLDVLPFPAHWRHSRGCDSECRQVVGRGAGPIRNQQMLDDGQPAVVHAFHKNLSQSRGTANMINKAHKAKVEVVIHD